MHFLRSIFLITCLAGPYLAIFAYLHHQKKQTRHEIKHAIIAGLDRSELVKLSFTAEELEQDVDWEHAGEFEYNGEMYDVVETATEGEKTVYWCWWDHEETSLNKRLNYLLAIALGNTNNEPDKHGPVSVFLKLLYTAPESITLIAPCEIPREHYPGYTFAGKCILLEIPAPPPRFHV